MERRVAEILNRETSRFYQAQARSFSGTRKAPWPGWHRCVDFLKPLGDRVRLFDLACGNLRFERFLIAQMPAVNWSFSAVDSCEELVALGGGLGEASSTSLSASGGDPAVDSSDVMANHPGNSLSSIPFSYQQVDVVSALLDGSGSFGLDRSGLFDACVSFGFLHHVPGFETRVRALRGLIEQALPGGLVMVSLWQFEKSPSILSQAEGLRERALGDLGLSEPDLEPGDHLLGWNKVSGVYRYCHSFSSTEVNHLLDAVTDLADPVDVFDSDGRTGDMNAYLVLERC